LNVIAYLRVSTSKQELSPKAQRDHIEQWCRRQGYELVATFEEKVSGGVEFDDLDKREALMAAIEALESGMALVVAKRDRLARNVASAAIIERLAERRGARVLAVDGVNNEDSPEAQLMRTLIDAFAQYERALIRSRIVQALGHKKAKGERVGGVPYGKQVAADGKTLVPSERDQKLVARIRRLHRSGISVRAIAAKVTQEGYRSRSGAALSKSTVGRLLRG
jgi:DNA invertase Pin-like site-specific DNA recombinase